jgi:hypothetical protein
MQALSTLATKVVVSVDLPDTGVTVAFSVTIPAVVAGQAHVDADFPLQACTKAFPLPADIPKHSHREDISQASCPRLDHHLVYHKASLHKVMDRNLSLPPGHP